jgi:hypothetical protein
MYAEALVDVASGVVRLRAVTVIGDASTPVRRWLGDDDARDGAGATGPSLVEQLTSSAAASMGRRKRGRMRRRLGVRKRWGNGEGNSRDFGDTFSSDCALATTRFGRTT